MSGNGVRKVGDDGDGILCVGGLIGRHVHRWGGVRKSRGRVRM